MFDNNVKKKSLIIVCDEETQKYADYLMAMISQDDEQGGENVMAAVWSPKNYKHSLPELTADTYILFIGSFDEAKNVGKNIDFIFHKYGMHYGWLGKRGVIYVSGHSIDDKEYEEFRTYAADNLKSIKKVHTKMDKFFDKAPIGIAAGLGIVAGASIVGAPIFFGALAANKKKRDNQIKEQRYTYLTLQFYYEGLQKFLEG